MNEWKCAKMKKIYNDSGPQNVIQACIRIAFAVLNSYQKLGEFI